MGKRCDCASVCRDHPDKTFEELIKMGLICEICANSYQEFCKFAKSMPEEEKIIEEALK